MSSDESTYLSSDHPPGRGIPADDETLKKTRVQSNIHGLANLAAARATCQPAAAARRSQARRGAYPTQNAGVHPRPRLRPAHGRLPLNEGG